MVRNRSGPTQVTAEYVGRWAHVDNDAGSEEMFIGQLSGTGNSIVLDAMTAVTGTGMIIAGARTSATAMIMIVAAITRALALQNAAERQEPRAADMAGHTFSVSFAL